MRSSAFSRGRQIGRVCDACKQNQNSSITFRITAISSNAPRNASSFTTPSQAQRSSNPQRRWLSATCSARSAQSSTATNASSSPPSASSQVPQTHYDLFPQTLPTGPPPSGSFDIDTRALRREFLQLQAKAHPDLHPEHLKSRAQATSARINEAYKTLSSPLHRAQYLLSLRGLDVANDETAKVEDPELLMEVLEAREEIEDAQEESELEGLKTRNEGREQESVAELARCFAEGDSTGAIRECVRLRYWVNIRESLHNWERGKPIVLEH
ncbi:Fe-S protein assembly co-chaperone HscB [Xylariales sp. AK1849]|nr:Fe-S protein assembly co-chaperone HscB [Xylariales sp. AK1849]